jgi:N-acetyl-gamma-glutamyl-phosphate reductase
MTVKVGIINVTGYAGSELARLLHRHPEAELVSVTGRSAAGKPLAEVFPHLRGLNLTVEPEITKPVDVVFSALPHAASAEALGPFLKSGVKCIDISADFRLKDRAEYESWYKVTHPYPEFIEEAVYGLTELHRPEVRRTRLVANPGCFPTGGVLAMAPAVREGIIEPWVIVDAKTGISGAGRSAELRYNFSELNDNSSPYGLSGHRHLPEFEQELTAVSSIGSVRCTFVPHLVPMTRGILSTCYARLKDGVSQQRVEEIFRDFYRDEPFVSVVPAAPATKQTWGSNECHVFPVVNQKAGQLVVISALDNLVKGAAGAGVQNMNVMLGMEETAGLDLVPVYP